MWSGVGFFSPTGDEPGGMTAATLYGAAGCRPLGRFPLESFRNEVVAISVVRHLGRVRKRLARSVASFTPHV